MQILYVVKCVCVRVPVRHCHKNLRFKGPVASLCHMDQFRIGCWRPPQKEVRSLGPTNFKSDAGVCVCLLVGKMVQCTMPEECTSTVNVCITFIKNVKIIRDTDGAFR